MSLYSLLHSLSDTYQNPGFLDLRCCTNLRSVLVRFEPINGDPRVRIWEGVAHTFSTLPRFSSPNHLAASTLNSVILDTAPYMNAEDAEENPYMHDAALRQKISEVESLLLTLFIDSNASQAAASMTDSEGGGVIFVKNSRQRFVSDFEGFIAATFPRLSQANLLHIPTEPAVYGGSCSPLCQCTFCIMMGRNRYS